MKKKKSVSASLKLLDESAAIDLSIELRAYFCAMQRRKGLTAKRISAALGRELKRRNSLLNGEEAFALLHEPICPKKQKISLVAVTAMRFIYSVMENLYYLQDDPEVRELHSLLEERKITPTDLIPIAIKALPDIDPETAKKFCQILSGKVGLVRVNWALRLKDYVISNASGDKVQEKTKRPTHVLPSAATLRQEELVSSFADSTTVPQAEQLTHLVGIRTTPTQVKNKSIAKKRTKPTLKSLIIQYLECGLWPGKGNSRLTVE